MEYSIMATFPLVFTILAHISDFKFRQRENQGNICFTIRYNNGKNLIDSMTDATLLFPPLSLAVQLAK